MERLRGFHAGLATASVIVVIGALHLGRDLLIPFALALLLSLMLAPMVALVQRLGIGRVPSVIAVVTLTLGLLGWLGWLASGQVTEVVRALPGYRETLKGRAAAVAGPLSRVLGAVDQTLREVDEQAARGREDGKPAPLRVDVVDRKPAVLGLLTGAAGSLARTAVAAAAIILLVVFLLVYQADVRDRLIQVIGTGQIHLTTQTMEEAATNVGRYLLAQSAINIAYGAAVSVGLFAMGVPNALLWGFLAGLLRYVPYLGPWMGAAPPVVLSLALFDGWTWPILVIGYFVLLEIIASNGVEPWLYGRRSGLSPLAVVAASIFWAWLWGALGLILAIPLTVCLVTLGRHLPRLRFLNTLLGKNPDLETEARLYQRLLARDPEAAAEIVGAAAGTPEEIGDRLLLPALALAEQDRHAGELDKEQSDAIHEIVGELVEDLGERPGTPPPPEDSAGVLVVCVPASDEADRLAADLLAQALRARRFRVEVLPASATTGEKAGRTAELRPDIVCLSALPPGAVMPARYLYKRLRPRIGDGEVVVGLWNVRGDLRKLESRIATDGKARVVGSLGEALRRVRDLSAPLLLQRKAAPAP
jgi:predicted PurR-regulated permease PerM